MNKLIARSIYPEGESKTYIHGKTRGRAFEITEELWTQEDGVNALSGDGAYLAWWGKGKKEQWEQRRQRKIFAVPYLTASPLTIN